MQRIHLFFLVLLAATLTGSLPSPAGAESRQATLTLRGVGSATVVPDTVQVRVGVETTARSAAQALRQNARRMQSVMAALKQAGVRDRQMQTSDFSVSPRYADRSNSQDNVPSVVGYQVRNTLTITSGDIKSVGQLLDQLVEAGSNNIEHIWFSRRETSRAMQRARQRAVADARDRAETYATAADMRLGGILSITEDGASAPSPMAYRQSEMAMATPIAPGEQTLQAGVTIVWTIEPD